MTILSIVSDPECAEGDIPLNSGCGSEPLQDADCEPLYLSSMNDIQAVQQYLSKYMFSCVCSV